MASDKRRICCTNNVFSFGSGVISLSSGDGIAPGELRCCCAGGFLWFRG